MNNTSYIALARVGRLACALLIFSACQGKSAGNEQLALAGTSLTGSAEKVDPARKRLFEAPLSELAFVPADAEAVIRVDLAALAAQNQHGAHALDYLLRAQQPEAWDFLARAGLHAGKQLRTLYLIVGAPTTGAKAEPTFAIAALGDIDATRVAASLRRNGGTAEPTPGGGVLFTWKSVVAAEAKVGASIPAAERTEVPTPPLGAIAIGVVEGFLVVGHPDLVRRALAVRAGEGKDIRTSDLATELLALESSALTWGAARAPGEAASWAASVMPGLRRARFHAALSGIAKGALDLRAEFGSPEAATAFKVVLLDFVTDVVKVTGETPLGKSLARVRDDARIAIDGSVLTVWAIL